MYRVLQSRRCTHTFQGKFLEKCSSFFVLKETIGARRTATKTSGFLPYNVKPKKKIKGVEEVKLQTSFPFILSFGGYQIARLIVIGCLE